MQEEWSVWIYNSWPNTGDYIQVDCEKGPFKEYVRYEGIIAGYDGSIFWFVGQPKPKNCDTYATRWRYRILKEFNPPLTAQTQEENA